MSDYVLALLNAVLFAILIFFCILLVLTIVIFFVAGFNFRRALNYATPLFVAFDAQMDRWHRVMTLAIIGLTVLAVGAHKDLTHYIFRVPSPSSPTGEWGLAIFGLWFLMFSADVLRFAGFPPALRPQTRSTTATKYQWIGLLLGLSAIPLVIVISRTTAHYLILPVFLAAIFATVLLYGGYVFHFSRELARSAYDSALLVEHRDWDELKLPTEQGSADIRFVHVTDVHLTEKAGSRNENEPSGNGRLENFNQELGGLRFRWLFITGDLVDHGRELEWKEARELLASFRQKNPDVRIAIAPGNHDLATAYNTSDAFFAASVARKRKTSEPISDGTYLERYLRNCSELNTGLLSGAGIPLETVLASKVEAASEIVAHWIAISAAEIPAADAWDRLAQRAVDAFPRTERNGWAETFSKKTVRPIPDYFREMLLPLIWRSEWFEHFPLYQIDRENREAVIVLNSNAPDPTLIGSAWGEMGQDQLDRLAKLLKELRGFTVYVLCHHAPFRWSGAGPPTGLKEIVGWSTSSVLADEIMQLEAALADFGHARGGEIVFLCGHRHGGPTRETMSGKWRDMTVIEAASFANPQTQIAVGWRDHSATPNVMGSSPLDLRFSVRH